VRGCSRGEGEVKTLGRGAEGGTERDGTRRRSPNCKFACVRERSLWWSRPSDFLAGYALCACTVRIFTSCFQSIKSINRANCVFLCSAMCWERSYWARLLDKFQASRPFKAVMSVFAWAVLLDMITDVQAGVFFFQTGNNWWGSIATVVLYLSFRFQTVFNLGFRPKLLGYFDTSNLSVPARPAAMLLLYVPGTWVLLRKWYDHEDEFKKRMARMAKEVRTKENNENKLAKTVEVETIDTSKLPQLGFGVTLLALFAGILCEVPLCVLVLVLTPFLAVFSAFEAALAAWKADVDFLKSPVDMQTAVFFAVLSQAQEAIFEALPQMGLQTRVFLFSQESEESSISLPARIYYPSVVLSALSLIKCVIVVGLNYRALMATAWRLSVGSKEHPLVEAAKRGDE
jgi:hypothetical protein